LACAAVAATAALAGCQQLGAIGYIIMGDQKDKFEAEYKDLPGHSVAVMVFADYKTQCAYPGVRKEMLAVINSQFEDKEHFKDVKVVDSTKVAQFQDEHKDWPAMDKTQIGKELDADYVLVVSLVEFTMHDSENEAQLRGRIVGEPKLYQTSKLEKECCVWPTSQTPEVRVIYPKEGKVGELSEIGEDDKKVRFPTEKEFADALVKRLYKHEEVRPE
jgi:TolB-like protein